MDTEYSLIREAVVDVKRVDEVTAKGAIKTMAEIVVGDKKGEKFVHRFAPTSRVSKHLEMMTAKELSDRLTGGTFFFVEDNLVDHRDGMYHGFTHDDNAIANFIDTLGYQYRSEMPLHRGSNRKRDGDSKEIVLRKVWSEGEIIIPKYIGNADFKTELSFVWNPFYKVIHGAFDLIRLICSNGMVGITPLLNPKIPLVNRWEEHLDIASRQVQNKIDGMVQRRVDQLVYQRSTLADCMLLRKHIFDRLHAVQKGAGDVEEDTDVEIDLDMDSFHPTHSIRDRLLNMLAAVEPQAHLSDVYKPAVFDNSAIAAQLPAHLSAFDVFNIATELRSHTRQSRTSSDFGLDKLSNRLMFGDIDDTVATAAMGTVKQSAFSSPERAFWGVVDAPASDAELTH